jgi:DNA polymerase-3 subunit gamma/tau
LLKALTEVQNAPDAAAAVDMALIRLTFAAELPPADKLARTILDAQHANAPAGSAPAAPPPPRPVPPSGGGARMQLAPAPAEPRPLPVARPAGPQPARSAMPASLKEVAALAAEMKAMKLKVEIEHNMRLVHFERGRIEIGLSARADRNAPGELAERLTAWTGERWIVSISNDEGEPTLAAQAAEIEAARRAEAAQDPLLKAALEIFPGAKILAVRDVVVEAAPATESENDT